MSVSSKSNESSKLSGIYLRVRRRHLDKGHVNEKTYSLRNSRSVYVGKITENNKLTKYMDLGNNEHKMKTVSDSLIELPNDPEELQNISDIYIQQGFQVIEISKSASNYNASLLNCLRAVDEQFYITNYATKS